MLSYTGLRQRGFLRRSLLRMPAATSVALIEPLGMIGGMGAAGGLALHDQQMANLTMITGLARRWASYNSEYYNTSVLVNHPDMYVAEASFQRMIQEAKSIELFTTLPA